MRVLLNNILKKFLLFLSMSCHIISFAAEQELGVAVEPMKLTLKSGQITYFTVINETEREYIVTPRVVSETETDGYKSDNVFVSNPPFKIIKKREQAVMGIVYLNRSGSLQDRRKYYLSVSFVPKMSENQTGVSIPVILVHQIPVDFK
ncbi:TPA: fimbria/pilus periplasmic chaperone [Escherichia coli]|uniref:fimbria/pilus periplasmic chaperone n=1 Tax=Escherichia coli TaxID=562 RepID=UPI002A6F6601|nr:fimbria/pilus periplasmic chaperone [Escherichia coli]EJU1294155.1 fimbria/pilus periplasmic chaperone [Escherichia coli]EJZ0857927.1 fimbria/pilus periplasmic chaperone [Escherichia coli]